MADEQKSCGGSVPHQFEPRYDEIGQKFDLSKGVGMFTTIDGPAYQRIYRGDVCVKCGKIVQIPASPEAAARETPNG